MTRDEFIKLLKENLEPNAEMNFLICDYEKPMATFLDIEHVGMYGDVDDPRNYNLGGVVFKIEEELIL